MSGPSIAELNRVNNPVERRLTGAIRRMAVAVTSKVLWQLVGYKVDAVVETLLAETFPGVGVYARPPAGSKPEAVVVFIAGAKSPAVIATRDEKTRAAMAGGIGEDETMLFNSQACVHINGAAVEVRSANGTAVELATKADLVRLADVFRSWTPVALDGGLSLKTLLTAIVGATMVEKPAATWPVGTSVLKGE
jgi:phage gp45-like